MEKFDGWLIRLNRWALQWILAVMAFMVFANVMLRLTTDTSILWVEELSRFLMIWLTFLGGGLVLRYGGHIGIDNLQEAFPRQAKVIRGVVFALMLAFFVFMLIMAFAIRFSHGGKPPPRWKSQCARCIWRCLWALRF